MATKLDPFDLKILNIIQRDNLTPLKVISENINLSIAATAKRLKRLRRERYILNDVSILNPKLMDLNVTVVVKLSLNSETEQKLNEIKSKLKSCACITQCFYVAGDFDFIIILSVKDLMEYEALTKTLFMDDPNINKFNSHIVLDKVKNITQLPLSVQG
ncbi:TPA: Lrp/AsnC family transcriptional regulator [Enterobacter chengduensis]|nr:Lrp/AsnC family transcriptional regulator [Enterobacter chengduensis]